MVLAVQIATCLKESSPWQYAVPEILAMGNIPSRKASSDRKINPELEWQDIFLFLKHSQYDQLEAILRILQDENKLTERADVQSILTTASQTCLTSAQLKPEEKWCRSYLEVLKRELGQQQKVGRSLGSSWIVAYPRRVSAYKISTKY